MTSTIVGPSGRSFEQHTDMIEATSLHRPDTGWVFIDAQGHEHRWYADGQPALSYSPSKRLRTPTLIWIKDGVGYWEDGEPYDIGHHECRICAEHIEPAYRADDTKQFVPGFRYLRIDGQPVDPETFAREVKAEFGIDLPER